MGCACIGREKVKISIIKNQEVNPNSLCDVNDAKKIKEIKSNSIIIDYISSVDVSVISDKKKSNEILVF